MAWRFLVVSAALLLVGCFHQDLERRDLKAVGQNCIKATEAWVKEPTDKRKLDQAVQRLHETNQALGKAPRPGEESILQDLQQLEGALNMAQVVVEQGQNPSRPSILSEFPAIEAVNAAVEQLRNHLGSNPSN